MLASQQRGTALVPQTIEGLWKFAVMVHKTGMAGKSLNTPEKVMVAMAWGMELGLRPLASIRNISVINGRPAVWGDAVMAMLHASGLCKTFKEEPLICTDGSVKHKLPSGLYGYRCTSTRSNGLTITHQFTLEDAARAGLTTKTGPWQTYPQRMLQMRPRSWVLRDLYADVLGGLILAEEAQDIPEAREELVTGKIQEAVGLFEAPSSGPKITLDEEPVPEVIEDAEIVDDDKSEPEPGPGPDSEPESEPEPESEDPEPEPEPEPEPAPEPEPESDDNERPDKYQALKDVGGGKFADSYKELSTRMYTAFKDAGSPSPTDSWAQSVYRILGGMGFTTIKEVPRKEQKVLIAEMEAIIKNLTDDPDSWASC